jgi:hypothetical protein
MVSTLFLSFFLCARQAMPYVAGPSERERERMRVLAGEATSPAKAPGGRGLAEAASAVAATAPRE